MTYIRRYVLGLALVAGHCQTDYNLRQGCLLVQKSDGPPSACLVYPSGKREPFEWQTKDALDYATAAAKAFGVGASQTRAFQPQKVRDALTLKGEQQAGRKAKKKAAQA